MIYDEFGLHPNGGCNPWDFRTTNVGIITRKITIHLTFASTLIPSKWAGISGSLISGATVGAPITGVSEAWDESIESPIPKEGIPLKVGCWNFWMTGTQPPQNKAEIPIKTAGVIKAFQVGRGFRGVCSKVVFKQPETNWYLAKPSTGESQKF